jgi:hypothetical protein
VLAESSGEELTDMDEDDIGRLIADAIGQAQV